jgi:hypothetical protein
MTFGAGGDTTIGAGEARYGVVEMLISMSEVFRRAWTAVCSKPFAQAGKRIVAIAIEITRTLTGMRVADHCSGVVIV